MPPAQYRLLHRDARLSDEEDRDAWSRALEAMEEDGGSRGSDDEDAGSGSR